MSDSVNNAISQGEVPEKQNPAFKIIIGSLAVAIVALAPISYVHNDYAKKRVYEDRKVDLNDRPIVDSIYGGRDAFGAQNSTKIKVVNFGEYEKDYTPLNFADGVEDPAEWYFLSNADATYEVVTGLYRNAKIGRFDYPLSQIGGKSTKTTIESISPDLRVCVVQSRQTANLSEDASYYLLSNDMPIFAKKDILDFAIKSHEGGHCFFNANSKDEDQNDLQANYRKNLNEISGDLVSILDYARVTGTLDMYTDFWRPYRLSNIWDDEHQTAWALDVVLKDIDPAAIARKGPEEIGPMVNYLMQKHFADPKGEFRIIQTPASQALVENLKAQQLMWKDSGEVSELKDKLKSDVAQTLVNHRAQWAAIAPDDAVALFDKRLAAWSKAYGIDLSPYQPEGIQPHKDRLDGKRPMGVLEYLTGKDHAL